MAIRFRFVEEDLSTVRLDLATRNSTPGANGFGVLAGADFGDVNTDLEFIQTSEPGATVAARHDPPIDTLIQLEAQHSSYANLRTLIRSLYTELQRGGIIEWRADGDATSYFMDVFPSPLPNIFRGDQFSNMVIMGSFQVVEFPVVLRRQPYLREASATLANGTSLTGDVAGMEVKVNNTSTMPSPARLEVTLPTASAEVVQLRCAIKSGSDANLTEFAGLYSFETDDPATDTTVTFGSNTTSQTLAAASGGKHAQTAYTATGYTLKRWKKVITPTTPAALKGTYKAYAVVRMTTGSKQTLCLHWGLKNSDPVDFTNDEVILDAQEAAGSIWTAVDLGEVKMEDDASVLVLEGWSRLDEDPGSSTLDWDYVVLLPTDVGMTTLSVIGFRGGQPSKLKWKGEDLGTPTSPGGLTGGTDSETTRILNAQNEAGGTKPNTGFVFPAGKVVVKFDGSLRQGTTSARQKLGELRVRDVTGSTNVATRDLYTKKNRFETNSEKQATFTADGTSAYQIQVVFTKGSPDADDQIVIDRLMCYSVRIVGNGDKLILDPTDLDATGLWSGSVKVADIVVSGAFPTLQPGYNTLVLMPGDWSGSQYQDDVDEREPLAKVVQGRTMTTTVKTKPLHPL